MNSSQQISPKIPPNISPKFPWKIYSKPITIQIILILLVLTSSGLVGKHIIKRTFLQQIESQLRDTAILLTQEIPTDHNIQASTGETSLKTWCVFKARGTDLRFTLIDRSGVVLCDSHHDISTMDNHAHRPEISEALRNDNSDGSGTSVRKSDTLDENLIYVAVLSPQKDRIVRAAVSLKYIESSFRTINLVFWIMVTIIAVILSFFAMWTGRKLIYPLSQVLEKARSVLRHNQDHSQNSQKSPSGISVASLSTSAAGEWSDLEESLDSIRKNLIDKIEILTHEREEQAALMSAISDAVFAVDNKEVPLFFNSRFAVLFGGIALKEKQALSEIFREPEVLSVFRSVLKTGQPADAKAIQLGKDRGRKFFSVSVSPLKNEKGHIYGSVGVFHDVTELKLAEQIRIDFVANVSHELRTPLTSIKGYADTLKSDFESHARSDKKDIPEQWNDFIQIIIRNTDRLMNLIGDLLDLSAIESSDRIQKTQIDTEEFSERAIQKIASLIKAKSHIVEIETYAKSVFADSIRLEQVMVNLLDNACKYTPTDGLITIIWEDGQDAAGQKCTLLKVSDTGPGIPPEHHSRLFERFYRVDKGRSREMGGTGLGLAIVKHIMQRHGGNVGIISEPGQGTTFVCTFPKNS